MRINYCRNGICRIVETIYKLECERKRNGEQEECTGPKADVIAKEIHVGGIIAMTLSTTATI
jgi:hypothetical protein